MDWEYKLFEYKAKAKGFFQPSPDLTQLESYLNELGRLRWELVNLTAPEAHGFNGRKFTVAMKRPK